MWSLQPISDSHTEPTTSKATTQRRITQRATNDQKARHLATQIISSSKPNMPSDRLSLLNYNANYGLFSFRSARELNYTSQALTDVCVEGRSLSEESHSPANSLSKRLIRRRQTGCLIWGCHSAPWIPNSTPMASFLSRCDISARWFIVVVCSSLDFVVITIWPKFCCELLVSVFVFTRWTGPNSLAVIIILVAIAFTLKSYLLIKVRCTDDAATVQFDDTEAPEKTRTHTFTKAVTQKLTMTMTFNVCAAGQWCCLARTRCRWYGRRAL